MQLPKGRRRGHGDLSVELDAIEPQRLRDLVQAAIERHLPRKQFEILKAAEKSEREIISRLARRVANGRRSHGFHCVHSSEVVPDAAPRDDDADHGPAAYVHAGPWTFTLAEVWDAIGAAEGAGVSLPLIAAALAHNRSAATAALVLRRYAVLRVLVDEAGRGRP